MVIAVFKSQACQRRLIEDSKVEQKLHPQLTTGKANCIISMRRSSILVLPLTIR